MVRRFLLTQRGLGGAGVCFLEFRKTLRDVISERANPRPRRAGSRDLKSSAVVRVRDVDAEGERVSCLCLCGHACRPCPGLRGSEALRALGSQTPRLDAER